MSWTATPGLSADDLAARAGVTLFDYQREFLEVVTTREHSPLRACLYYKTGAGKSLTSLAAVALLGYDTCVVMCPPSTHEQWRSLGATLGVKVEPMSHAKFRQRTTKLSRTVPVIADEFHMFGGQKGQGWRKLDKLAQHLQAPLILCSATPNYNDAERCYCVQHILNPHECRGGYLQFLYQHCVTEQNPFGMEPKVLGFHKYPDAAAFLADMKHVYYLPDDTQFTIADITYSEEIPAEMEELGYDRRNHRLMASQMERRHIVRYMGMVDEHGFLHQRVLELVLSLIEQAEGPVMLFAAHATIASAVARSLDRAGEREWILVTGNTPKPAKDRAIRGFKVGWHKILIGTATLATGTDGLDRACDVLVILDDTDDDALRRQLIGRILPRGDYVSAASKKIFRLMPEIS